MATWFGDYVDESPQPEESPSARIAITPMLVKRGNSDGALAAVDLDDNPLQLIGNFLSLKKTGRSEG